MRVAELKVYPLYYSISQVSRGLRFPQLFELGTSLPVLVLVWIQTVNHSPLSLTLAREGLRVRKVFHTVCLYQYRSCCRKYLSLEAGVVKEVHVEISIHQKELNVQFTILNNHIVFYFYQSSRILSRGVRDDENKILQLFIHTIC